MPAPRQWLWFVGLWAAGVGVTALVGYAIKLWLKGECHPERSEGPHCLLARLRSFAALRMTIRPSAAAAGS